jgi:ZIP family zinc transporter
VEGAAFAFSLSLAAGLATLLGFALSLLRLGSSDRFLSFALAFAGGAMIFVSFGEILGKAGDSLIPQVGEGRAGWVAVLGFFAGIAVAFLIDRAVPLHLGPASGTRKPRARHDHEHLARARLERIGMFSAAAIGLHNLPEGIASFAGGLEPSSSRLALPLAIALHNIPEGIAIAAPIYRATGSRARAFAITLAAALAEPLGAAFAWLALEAMIGSILPGLTFAMVAGIMVYISVDELLPAAREHGDDASATGGFVLGMAVMATSLQLLS